MYAVIALSSLSSVLCCILQTLFQLTEKQCVLPLCLGLMAVTAILRFSCFYIKNIKMLGRSPREIDRAYELKTTAAIFGMMILSLMMCFSELLSELDYVPELTVGAVVVCAFWSMKKYLSHMDT